METNLIGFPGLGLGPVRVPEVAFVIPIGDGIPIRFYTILVMLGMLAALAYVFYRSRYEGFQYGDVIDYFLAVIPLGVIGARLFYVVANLGKGTFQTLYDVIAIWNGGLAIYGGVIGGVVAVLIVSKFKKLKKDRVLKAFDMIVPAMALGQCIGRWGNFFNAEAYGLATSEHFFLRMGFYKEGSNQVYFCHPTFLYESVWNLCCFLLLHFLYKKKKFNGQILMMYLAFYGFGRMFIEGLRENSLYFGPFRVSQLIGFLCFVICTALLVYLLAKEHRKALDSEEYVSIYDSARRSTVSKTTSRDTDDAEADIDAIIARTAQEQKQREGENEDNGNVD
ncbi:MAG: prolipoprotein diacylglyceryl transferase [Clostridia bacterium]|nr:prolipoprotein diacylglyceryl transferase [Clostridia bacterium]